MQPNPSISQRFLPADAPSVRVWATRTVRELAAHDWLVLGYALILLFAAWQGSGPARDSCLVYTSAILAGVVLTLAIVRGGLIRDSFVAPMLYRVGIYGAVQLSYFLFRDLLPTATSRSVDEALFRLDERLFGVEPTVWLDQFVTSRTTEWFAFFYFNYFLLLAVHVLPFLFLSKRLKLFSEFGLSLLLLFCFSHTVYMLVPGYGPYRHLAALYLHQLPPGTWCDLVMNTVSSAGAQKDIFPSLHTGAPTLMALFSFRHRDKLPFKYTWPVAAFFALNIIGATVFLRWHYLVDVLAGLTFASSSLALAVWIRKWEVVRRAKLDLQPTWPLLFGRVDPNEAPVSRLGGRSPMELPVVQRARVGGFDYVLVGRGTGCVMCDAERIDAGGLRSLLAASERDQLRTGFVLRQTAWYLPRVTWVDDPFDIGAACVSYLMRHPRLETAYVVAPTQGLIRMVLDFVAQRMPKLDTRIASDPAEVTTALRALEPALPMHWYRPSVYPEAGGRVSSIMPAAPAAPGADGYGAVPRAPAVPRFEKPPRK